MLRVDDVIVDQREIHVVARDGDRIDILYLGLVDGLDIGQVHQDDACDALLQDLIAGVLQFTVDRKVDVLSLYRFDLG